LPILMIAASRVIARVETGVKRRWLDKRLVSPIDAVITVRC